MVVIKFADTDSEETGLGLLFTRFPFTSLKTGETIVPPEALPALTAEGVRFSVEGSPNYEQLVSSLRDAVAKAV